jgi:hypothetical protein
MTTLGLVDRKQLIVAAFSLAIALGASFIAQVAAASSPELIHALRNISFIGPLGVEKEQTPAEDVLSFKEETFASKTCAEWGFSPAPYWLRRDTDGLHFRAELHSPEHGVMRFEGVFDGNELVATAVWIKRRWYWTIEQKFRFKGRPLPLGR